MIDLSQFLSHKSHIIWDWNGTLLNDVELCVDVICEILDEHGLPRIEVSLYKDQFCFPVKNYYQSLGFDFEKVPFEDVSNQFIRKYYASAGECDLFTGCRELLDSLTRSGKKCSILSAAHNDHIFDMLAHHGLRDFFEHVFGIDNVHAHGKLERGHQLIKLINEDKSNLVLVGDTDHDAEVANALGIDAILLADGHQSLAVLENKAKTVIPCRYSI